LEKIWSCGGLNARREASILTGAPLSGYIYDLRIFETVGR